MKNFQIPDFYRSSIITRIKYLRKNEDPRKKDFSPALLDFGRVQFLIPRHFGFCYGVENAIEIAYRTIDENPGKRIFLLSEMIHNPGVNEDLNRSGVRFLMDTKGNFLDVWNELSSDDIVIIPAFGTTLEIEQKLNEKGIDPYKYNTTCPFVEKVWNRSGQLGDNGYTIIIHGKHYHEETRATFSHSKESSPSLIIRDIKEAEIVADYILGKTSTEEFNRIFSGKHSPDFDPEKHLIKLGVVNQTTMLASETEAIAVLLKGALLKKYGEVNIKEHFADTRDTLCYATYDNQEATTGLLTQQADIAIVVGGYNSSNTSHIVELLEGKFKTFFISGASKLEANKIDHYDIHSHSEITTYDFLPGNIPARFILSSGASCPDAVVEAVLRKIVSFYPDSLPVEEVFSKFFPSN